MFEVETISVAENHTLHVISVKEIAGQTKELLDKFFVSICEGESDSELGLVKSRLANFLKTKKEDTQMGAVAEFFVHLYLNTLEYKQEFLFFNLEEGSIKKGFDGIFSKDGQTYLVESKSGSILSHDAGHKKKLKVAYSDLRNYVSGKSEKGKNNPWKNAYNHASHCDVGAGKSIRKKIKDLRDMYDYGKYTDISEYNVVPCSTLYLASLWDDSEQLEIIDDHKFIVDFQGLTVNAICITKTSLNNFFKYLGE